MKKSNFNLDTDLSPLKGVFNKDIFPIHLFTLFNYLSSGVNN